MVAVAVLGVPRSGTSLVAGLLHALGVCMGQEWLLMPDPSWQPKCTYVDRELNALHDRMMTGREAVYGMDVCPEARADYHKALARRDAEHAHWGVKCHDLPFVWRHFVAGVSAQVVLVRTSRPDKESRDSLEARCGDRDIGPWLKAVESVCAEFAGPVHTVAFTDAIRNPRETVARLADFAGVPYRADAALLVQPEWKRF